MKRFLASPKRVVFRAAVLSAALLLGCSGGSRNRSAPLFGAVRGSGAVTVTIQNNDFKDAVIYANWQGTNRRRVGLAIGKTTQTFTMEWQAESVQFVADFIAGGTFPFDVISVFEGDHLDLIIMNQG